MYEVETPQSGILTPMSEKKASNSKLSIISLLIAVFALLIAIFSATYAHQLSVQNDDVTKEDIEFLNNFANTLSFQHIIESGVVTDDFYVDKAIFRLNNVTPTAVIDVANQPSMSIKYKNSGDFDLTDRELKNKVSDLMTAVKEAYDSFGMNNIHSWDEIDILVTIQNYDIATYKGGETLLKGE